MLGQLELGKAGVSKKTPVALSVSLELQEDSDVGQSVHQLVGPKAAGDPASGWLLYGLHPVPPRP